MLNLFAMQQIIVKFLGRKGRLKNRVEFCNSLNTVQKSMTQRLAMLVRQWGA